MLIPDSQIRINGYEFCCHTMCENGKCKSLLHVEDQRTLAYETDPVKAQVPGAGHRAVRLTGQPA